MKIFVVSVVLLVAQSVYSVPVVSDTKHIEVSKAQVEIPAKVHVAVEKLKTLPATTETALGNVNEINPLVSQWLEYIKNYFGQLMYPDRYNRILEASYYPERYEGIFYPYYNSYRYNRNLEPYYNPERYERIFYPYYNSYRYNRILYPYYNQDMRYIVPNGLKRPLESNFINPYFLNQRIFNPFRGEFLRDREEELPRIETSGGYDYDHKTYDEGYDKNFHGEGVKGHGGDKWHQGKEGYDDKWDHDKLGPGGKGDHEKGDYDHEGEHSKGKW